MHQLEINFFMNERIKELADEAAKFSAILALPTGESGDKLFVEKFAQLIVRECASELIRWKDEPFPYDPEFGAKLIRKHFGVEE